MFHSVDVDCVTWKTPPIGGQQSSPRMPPPPVEHIGAPFAHSISGNLTWEVKLARQCVSQCTVGVTTSIILREAYRIRFIPNTGYTTTTRDVSAIHTRITPMIPNEHRLDPGYSVPAHRTDFRATQLGGKSPYCGSRSDHIPPNYF